MRPAELLTGGREGGCRVAQHRQRQVPVDLSRGATHLCLYRYLVGTRQVLGEATDMLLSPGNKVDGGKRDWMR